MIDTTALQRYAEEFKALGITTSAGAQVSRTVETEQACWSVIRLRLDEDKRVCALDPLIGSDENEIRGLASDAAVAAEIGDTAESWFDCVCSTGLNQIPGLTNSGSINGAPHHSTTIYIERLCDLSAVVCKDIIRKVEFGELPPKEALQQQLSTCDDPRPLAKSIIGQCESKAAGLRVVAMVNDRFNRRLESLGTVAEIAQLHEAGKIDEVIERYNKAQEGGQIAALEVMATWVRYSPGAHSPATMEHLARIAASRCWSTLREHFRIPVEYLRIHNGHPFAPFEKFEAGIITQQAGTDWNKPRIEYIGGETLTADCLKADPKPALPETKSGAVPISREVDHFIARCNKEAQAPVIRKHIWLAVGHKSPRQFQFWQASSSKATDQDEINFRRILNMAPCDFVALLVTKNLIQLQ